MTDDELLEYNRLGLIPGPNEEEKDFLQRVDFCLDLKEKLAAQGSLDVPAEMEVISPELANQLSAITQPLFDISPRWIPIIFSNHKLSPWHGGCAWIFQLTEDSPLGAFFQLRSAFKNKKRYLGLYDRDELLAHEAVHVGRMHFEEPKFEEVLAFRTAKSWFRRWLGPIMQSPWESLLFLFSIFLCAAVQIFLLISDVPQNSTIGIVSLAFPIGLLAIGLIRLWQRQSTFNNCLQSLKIFAGENNGNAIIFRLQDKEIIAFSKMSIDDICQYASSQKTKSLRWRLIYKAYFEN